MIIYIYIKNRLSRCFNDLDFTESLRAFDDTYVP